MLMNDLLDGGSDGAGSGAGDAGAGAPDGGSGDLGGDGGGEGGSGVPGWLSSVDPNLAADPSLQNIKDMDGLVKSYIHAQKLVGSDKMVVPGKNSTPEDWKSAFNQLGLPESKDNYAVNRAENSKLSDDFHNALVEKAYDLNILPNQAQGIADFYEEMIAGAESKHMENMQAVTETNIANLKEEWGDGFQRKVAAANHAIDNFGGEGLRAHLKQLGLSNDPAMVKLFSNIGEQMSEDDFAASDSAGFGSTPEQATEKMNSMLMDPNHPINNPQHANHKAAQAEYNKLAKQASPQRKK